MDNIKIISKIMRYIEKYASSYKDKYIDKIAKILKKNSENEELFKILFEQPDFHLIIAQIPEVIEALNVNIQKMTIEKVGIEMFRFLNDNLRSDKEYISYLLTSISEGKYDTETAKNVNVYIFHHLGKKLDNDPDYLMSIQDISPSAFASSIERINYDEKTLLEFFEKYPEYLTRLPNDLKNNYDYVIDLIDRLDNYGINCMVDFGFDYIRIPEIKDAIIKRWGKEKYGVLLVRSIKWAENNLSNKKLKEIDIEKLREFILIEPTLFENKIGVYFLSDSEKKDLLLTTKKAASIKYEKVDNPEKLSQLLFELSNVFGKNLNYNQIFNQVKSNWDQFSNWVQQVNKHDDNGKIISYADKRTFYLIYNILVGIECNKVDEMFKVFINKNYRESPYAKGIKNIEVTEVNLPFIQLICTTPIFELESNNIELYNKLFIKLCNLGKSPYELVNFIKSIGRDNKLLEIIRNLEIDKLDGDLLLNLYNYVQTKINVSCKISNITELNDYEKFVDNNIDKIPNNSLEERKNRLLLQYFQITLQRAEDLVHSYLISKENSQLYLKKPEVLYLKQMLETITTVMDVSELEKIEVQLLNKPKISFKDVDNIIKQIKIYYGNELQQNLYNAEIKNGIIDITNQDFNLLVHVVDAYGKGFKGTTYESWNTSEGTAKVSICTSYISDNNMGIAYQNSDSVILGFNNLPEDYLELMSCEDLSSQNFTAPRESKFLTSNELINNTRHTHNELVIRRRKGMYSETKVQPSYIICFDNINEKSKEAAKDFGIPILFIDREKVAERHHIEIVNKVEQFKNTLNPNLIPQIISEQENNRSGLRGTRPDICEKCFGQPFRQNNIIELYNAINNGLKSNHPNAINAMNKFVYSINIEKQKYEDSKDHGSRISKYDLQTDKMVETLEKHPNYKNEKVIQEKLTPEELYMRFLECRENLNANEMAEIEKINKKNLNKK